MTYMPTRGSAKLCENSRNNDVRNGRRCLCIWSRANQRSAHDNRCSGRRHRCPCDRVREEEKTIGSGVLQSSTCGNPCLPARACSPRKSSTGCGTAAPPQQCAARGWAESSRSTRARTLSHGKIHTMRGAWYRTIQKCKRRSTMIPNQTSKLSRMSHTRNVGGGRKGLGL